jgi:hypothetical protein
MATKKRMTAQSKVNIGAATSAHIEPNGKGYIVVLTGQTGKSATVQGGDGVLIYSSMAAAKKAVSTHNPELWPALKPEI